MGRDGKQHVLVAGSIEEGLQRLVEEYPALPPPSHDHHHHHQAKSGDGERFGGGDGILTGAVTEGNQEEQKGFPGPGRRSLGRVFVIGGAQIYDRALELDNCERVLWTRLEREWDCDVWFPSGIFVDQHAEDVGQTEEGAEQKRRRWGRRSDDELDAWCGERVAGKKQQQLGEQELEWEVQMWERNRASLGDDGES